MSESPTIDDKPLVTVASRAADTALNEVVRWLTSKPLGVLIPRAVRQAIDEVLDGPRTGRWSVDQLEKTEKIYIGTKIEIVTRTALGLERTGKLDTVVEGHEVDFKWSYTSSWEFPTEAMGEICLLIGGRAKGTLVDVGLVRAEVGLLNPGRNKDGKGTLSRRGRGTVTWLATDLPVGLTFLGTLDPSTRREILSGRSGQERVRNLFRLLPSRPIPRLAIETVAQQRDPMRRLRADRIDRMGGIKVLSARYERKRLEALGFVNLESDDFVGVPASKLARAAGGVSGE